MSSLLAGKSGTVAVAIGVVAAIATSRNAFLMSNIVEMTNRFKHTITGDRYEAIKVAAERDPWFGKAEGVVVVTGSNSGMGFETAMNIAKTGCRVILAVRSKERGDAAADKIRQATGSDKIDVMLLDLTSVESVRAFAAAFIARKLPLHVLLHNAGASGKEVNINTDGLEDTMALNYLNVVLLTSLLLPVIKETSPPARIIIVGSAAHHVGVKSACLSFGDRKENPVNGWDLYGSSKLSVTAYSNYLARQLSDSEKSKKISVIALDPGFVATSFYNKPVPFPVSIFGKVAGLAAKDAETGSHSSLFAALSPIAPPTGSYIADTLESASSATAVDEEFQKQLMDATVKKIKSAAPWWNEAWF